MTEQALARDADLWMMRAAAEIVAYGNAEQGWQFARKYWRLPH